jgi:alanine or glycine:cation symporter, AGCS family
MRTFLGRLLTATLLILMGTGAAPAHAGDEGPGGLQALQKSVDEAFGTYLVGPLATVMFFDVLFWDDTLPMGTLPAESPLEVVRYEAATGYHFEQRVELLGAVAWLPEPTERTLDKIKVSMHTEWVEVGDNKLPRLAGSVLEQPVNLAALGLEPLTEDTPAEEGTPVDRVVRVDGLAPFSVEVDRLEAKVVKADLVFPPNQIAIKVGDQVALPGHPDHPGIVMAVSDKGVVARVGPERIEAGPLANSDNAVMPIVVLWLVLGAVFFTLRMQFINLRGFVHAVKVTAGKYDEEDEEGEISHFQALSSALSATVGLGNIAGVAIAISVGGPGAIFWMVMAGILGMSSKFTECTLGQMYRVTKPDGSVSGGPMHYLDKGLKELGLGPVATFTAYLFALMCIGGSLGGGNMFQANQSYAALAQVVPPLNNTTGAIVFGLVLAFLVGLVIIGGIKRIGAAAGTIVPLMCTIYVLAGMFILIVNAAEVPAAMQSIVVEAFSPAAGLGGMIGVLAQGFKRASFSNEAGIGSASIAHSAATTNYPVREGIVSLLEPFIDTVIVCTMTGLVVVVTGSYQLGGSGVVMTQAAFGSVISWFPILLSVAVVLFAFSTMISWSYYGERCVTWALGDGAKLPYRVLFLACTALAPVLTLENVVTFSDLMVLGMAFPNVFGAVLLSGKVKRALDAYWAKLKNGDFDKAAA